MKKKKRISPAFFTFLLLLMLSPAIMHGQCEVTAYSYPDTIYAGDEVTINSYGNCGLIMADGFGNGTLSSWFSPTQVSPLFNNPCGPGPNGSHSWISENSSSQVRAIQTTGLDLSNPGTEIKWYMRYGKNASTGTCNSLSTSSNGVHLQYSTDGGNTWTDFPGPNITPTGNLSNSPPFITDTMGSGGFWAGIPIQDQSNNGLYFWNSYKNTIPTAAAITNTQIRWVQLNPLNANSESWGLDEIEIYYSPGNISVS